MNNISSETPCVPSRFPWKKVAVFVTLAGVIGTVCFFYGDALALDALAQQESKLRAFQANHPVLVFGVAFCVYVAVAGLSLPGATALSLLYGWYFGFWAGLILVSFSSTAGATVAFLLSRYLFRDTIQSRFGERLDKFNASLEREGPFFLFTLRLIPAVPFFVINAVMGLTPIRTGTFWWVSQLGMLPGTAVYLYAGSRIPSLQVLADQGIHAVFSPQQTAQIFIAFALLGLFPVVARWVIKWRSGKESPSSV